MAGSHLTWLVLLTILVFLEVLALPPMASLSLSLLIYLCTAGSFFFGALIGFYFSTPS